MSFDKLDGIVLRSLPFDREGREARFSELLSREVVSTLPRGAYALIGCDFCCISPPFLLLVFFCTVVVAFTMGNMVGPRARSMIYCRYRASYEDRAKRKKSRSATALCCHKKTTKGVWKNTKSVQVALICRVFFLCFMRALKTRIFDHI